MGHKNREVEAKLLIELPEGTLPLAFSEISDKVESFVASLYPEYTEIRGKSSDVYWKAPKYGDAAFCRLRKNPDGKSQITIKSNDKGDNIDRVEIDLDVEDSNQAKALLNGLLGESIATVLKRYDVFFLENHDTNISVYYVIGDSENRIFIEGEARTLKRLQELISGLIAYSSWCLVRVGSSVHDMFVANKKMKVHDITEFLERK